MKTELTQGLFITLITLARTLTISANQPACIAPSPDEADTVPIPPRVNVAANLLVLRTLSRAVHDRLEIEKHAGERVFRYSSSGASSCASPSLKRVLG